MQNFTNRVNFLDGLATSLVALGVKLAPEDRERLNTYKRNWNFYEGYHWEEIPDTGRDEVTKNYCRAFVNKFVAFELGKGFNIRMKPEIEPKILPFLNEVWEDNDKESFCQLFGQSKSVTGDSWVQVSFEPKYDENGNLNSSFIDPYNEYEKGRVRINVLSPNLVFPKYNAINKDLLEQVTIMYPVKADNGISVKLYSQEWTRDTVVIKFGDEQQVFENKYLS